MARCKDCRDYDECKKIPYPDGIYPEEVNDVETKCDFYYKAEREKDMVSCKECANGEVCGDVMEKGAEKCEVFVDKPSAKEKYMKQVYGEPPFGNVAPSAEWQKEKEVEATTLKIKAAGYDVIKGIVGESFENVWEPEDTVTMIDGVLRMEEAVMKTLI